MTGWTQNGVRRRAFAGAILGAALLLAGGCGGGSGFNNNGSISRATDLTGTWDLSGLSAGGKPVSCPSAANVNTVVNILTVNNVEADRCYIGENIAFSGNTYTITYPAPRFLNLTIESGTYSFDGDTLILTRTTTSYDTNNDGIITADETTTVSPSQKVTASFSVEGNILTITPQSSDSANDIRRTVAGDAVQSTYTLRTQ